MKDVFGVDVSRSTEDYDRHIKRVKAANEIINSSDQCDLNQVRRPSDEENGGRVRGLRSSG